MSERFNKERGLKAEELSDISTQNTDYKAWIKKGVIPVHNPKKAEKVEYH
jgi:hypothetical protein